MCVSSFAIGLLSIPIFDLGFVDALLTTFFINVLGTIPVAFFSTFGPRFGMRQMVLSRFFFGYYGVKVIAVFNCLACLGWSSVNVIVGAQLLHAVNSDMPGWAGIIVIAACTFIITCFGYKVVHIYEMWSWIPCFAIFLVVLGEFAHSGQFSNLKMGAGTSEAASVLSYAASVFGFATGWTSYASDYTCYQPVGTSRTKIFIWVWAGLLFPLCFCEMLGVAIATATVNSTDYANAYFDNAVGGILAQVLVPPLGKFGQFCLVILALSIIGNNCPNIYSLTFSLQILSHYAQRVPRFIWTFIGTCIYIAIAIPGYSHFESVLENFMLVIGYWLAIYEGIALPEHFLFRKGAIGYAPETYDQPNKLPPGLAAGLAFCFGVCGAVLGMAQVWVSRLCCRPLQKYAYSSSSLQDLLGRLWEDLSVATLALSLLLASPSLHFASLGISSSSALEDEWRLTRTMKSRGMYGIVDDRTLIPICCNLEIDFILLLFGPGCLKW